MSGGFTPYTGEVLREAPAPPAFKPYEGDVQAEKPLSWGDVGAQAIKNAPHSAKEAVVGMVQPIIHPYDTATNLIDVVKGIASKMEDADAPTSTGEGTGMVDSAAPVERKPRTEAEQAAKAKREEKANAIAKFYATRYGSLEGFKKALAEDPVGIAMDLGTVLSGGEAGVSKLGPIAKVAAKAVDPVAAISGTAKTAGKIGEAAGSHTLGHLTGGGPEAIRQSVKAGFNKETEFLDALFNKTPLEDSVKLATKGVQNMRKERNDQYQLMKRSGMFTDPEVLDFGKVKDARKSVDDVGAYKGVPLYTGSADVRREVGNVLDAWEKLPKDEFHTVEGFDALKKKLGDMLDHIPYDQKSSRKYVGDIKRAVTEQINQQAPGYAKMMKDYHAASEGLEEIERALSLGEKATYDSGIRKLLSAMRNNANSNYGNRLKMIDALEEAGSKGLKSTLAGAQMSSGMPRGMAGGNPGKTLLASIFAPGALAALPFESPKLVGRGLYGIGSAGGNLRDILTSTIVPDASVRKYLPSPEATARGAYQAGETSERTDGR